MSKREKLKNMQDGGSWIAEPGTGGCLQQALRDFGYSVDVDEFFPVDEIGDLCDGLGLVFYPPGSSFILPAETPIVAIYQTDEEEMTHAVQITPILCFS